MTWDPDEQDRISRRIAEICRADLPVTLLVPDIVTNLADRRIRGLSSPWRVDPFECMGDLWLEGE
jgi:hypothetical protein